MAMNKSGLPPMIRPVARALIPGGAGTVEPKKPKPFLKLGSMSSPVSELGATSKFAQGGLAGMLKASGLSTNSLPKIPKPPKPGGPAIKIV